MQEIYFTQKFLLKCNSICLIATQPIITALMAEWLGGGPKFKS